MRLSLFGCIKREKIERSLSGASNHLFFPLISSATLEYLSGGTCGSILVNNGKRRDEESEKSCKAWRG
jgi:hypothetical protein